MAQPFVIAFAGPVGSSKSPIAQALSLEFELPLFSNDTIRTELKEDRLKFDISQDDLEPVWRDRLTKLHDLQVSYVYDASLDRNYETYLETFASNSPYHIGVISIDLSEAFYLDLLKAKRYDVTANWAKALLADHQRFSDVYSDVVIASITDDTFADRLATALASVHRFIGDNA